MNLSSLWEMTKGRWREFRREPSAFFFVIAMPLIWMLVLGHAFNPGSEKEHYRVGFLDHGDDPFALRIKRLLQANPKVELISKLEERKREKRVALFVEFKDKTLIFHQNINHQDSESTMRWVND